MLDNLYISATSQLAFVTYIYFIKCFLQRTPLKLKVWISRGSAAVLLVELQAGAGTNV